ncbi:hypothetical protein [Chroococcidiopsis sp. CCMEE 29]|uniref:hypothetical protein n=1 Tax=Chroococcidiopsis sp. CCMEE 29 TaxID=155894 RepID=UPI002020C44C|nr:hypothetical protein [Chroococcidiopsis sp. CCMEE 29]
MLEVRHFSIVSVIFSALTAEAFINHYGITKTSKNYFKYLDRLNLVDKWIIVPKVVTGNSIEPGSHSIQCLNNLVGLRNKLVHYKTRKVSIETIDDWESLGMASFDDAQNGIEAIRLSVKALNKIDESVETQWLDNGSNLFMF